MNRDEIVDKGLEMVEATGGGEISLRALAKELGVSAPALYEYIDSKDELLRLLAREGYDELAARWEAVDGPPLEWILGTARAYVVFAVERPGLFALMHRFSPAAISGDPGIEHPAASALFDAGISRIGQAVDDGELRDDDPLDLAIAVWAAAYGVAVVSMLTADADGATALTDRVIGGLLDGWRPS